MNAKDPNAFIRGLITDQLLDLEDERGSYLGEDSIRVAYIEERIENVKDALHYFNRLVGNEPAKAEEEKE